MPALPTKLDVLHSPDIVERLKRAPSEHKGDAGKAILIGGAPGMAGALLLAGKACLYLGAGWTIIDMLDPASAHADSEQAELMIRLAKEDAVKALNQSQPDVIAIGPGLGHSALAIEWLIASLNYPRAPLIIDADALNLIADSGDLLNALQKRNQQFPGQSILTPHPGEAARLLKSTTAQIQADRSQSLQNLVALTQSIIVLKGQHTLIAGPLHSAVQCEAGNPGMGTGGMGDVLTGSITAIAAQGVRHHLDLWDAGCIAVQLHAMAADSLVQKGVGPIGLTPSETILEMRRLLNKLL
ncbi:NAD(P)H-hydrate dehydratase [Polynucleobacter wuianus]|uniref:ADP-dependent (S)-NAD(P)H-hydrate dehydratase n=1 Tax=Polynucleobacter wuianus TaxID=1743168 RepID=A0A191UDY3_9BURK|nr:MULTISPECIES: NAD(P)H-hydrate dehydratase [Polynucleobacter]ANI99219.1 NAD(P)H-hydrate dehydratase [Polynucleobacter wuianus]MBU3552200.1 NAD(P)H-hydrate dehydratase [Polynucleobacter sp. MWH-Post4-6-1]MBU3608969.1 NAD(P)H-hydrate dehydratase [Polynucleobacter wuianus]